MHDNKWEPRAKYSSIINKDNRFKNVHNEGDSSERVRPFTFRDH